MLITIDAGNSQIKIAVFNDAGEMNSFGIVATNKEKSCFLLPDDVIDRTVEYTGCVISSVVPELNHAISQAILQYAGIQPVFIHHQTADWLNYDYEKPEMIGSDRIANVIAGQKFFQPPFLVCDFGTATTISCMLKSNEFSGGFIAPGIKTSLQALNTKASRLPETDISQRNGIIGKSTYDCIANGVYYMQRGYIQEIIKVIREEYPALKTLCTGGYSAIFKEIFDIQEDNLVLKGCRDFFHLYLHNHFSS